MATVQLNTRIDEGLKRAIDAYCQSKGIEMNYFVHEALLARLEEVEDKEDLEQTRREPTRPLADVMAELKLNGSV